MMHNTKQVLATDKNPMLGRLKFSIFKTPLQCAHGPKSWKWWQFVAFRLCHLSVYLPSTGRALWIYTRWGAVALDFIIDRRRMVNSSGEYY